MLGPLHRPAPRAAAVLLLALLPLTACGTDDDSAASEPTVSATTAAPSGAPSTPAEPSTTPDDAQTIAVTVAGGNVTGVEPRTVVPVGTRVRLVVTSDTADEVHVHGYEKTLAVPAGQPAQVEFVADTPGLFEVELHDAGTLLTRLQVQ